MRFAQIDYNTSCQLGDMYIHVLCQFLFIHYCNIYCISALPVFIALTIIIIVCLIHLFDSLPSHCLVSF